MAGNSAVRRIGLTILTLLVAFCLGASLIAMAGAAVFFTNSSTSPVQATPSSLTP